LLSHQYPICIPLLPHSCYMPRPSHPSSLDHSTYTFCTPLPSQSTEVASEKWCDSLNYTLKWWVLSTEQYRRVARLKSIVVSEVKCASETPVAF
jgi:hypothetical protein